MTAIVGIDAEVLMVSTATLASQITGGVGSVSIASGGSGYSVNDVLTITGGNADAKLLVTSVNAGVVDGVSIIDNGEQYAVASAQATTVVPANGTGCTINILTITSLVLPAWNPTTQAWDLSVNNNEYSWIQLTERNEISLSISVDVAEHKVFVTNIDNAWVEKARLYMDWSGSFSGYYDDASDQIFTTMKAGVNIYVCMIDSKAHITATGKPTKYWLGRVLLTSVDHSIPNEDFSTLDVDFEGNGVLYRSSLPAS